MNRWVLREVSKWPLRGLMQRCMSVSSVMSSVKAHENPKGLEGKRTPKKKVELKPVKVRRVMSVKELADAVGRTVEHINECLGYVEGGEAYRSRSGAKVIDNFDLISDVVKLNGFKAKMEQVKKSGEDEEAKMLDAKDEYIERRPKPDPKVMVRRPPVVTIMGHVDHGKTTLLDRLRNTRVVETEFGGITQHIGAFNCKLSTSSDTKSQSPTERSITFLDTPGHAAFASMRERGAKLTDIIVLVIAAEDGVMAQTRESIELAKMSSCPIIVAINKIDKASETQIAKTKQALLTYNLQAEDMGGDTQVVPISALKGTNIDRLKEEIWALAEVLELKGDPKSRVEAYVVESCQDTGRGKLATLIVKRGTLKKGAYLVSGLSYCKVKQMFDHNMKTIDKVSLSEAVQVMGWKEALPQAGDAVLEVDSESRAKEVVEVRRRKLAKEKESADAVEIEKRRSEHTVAYRQQLLLKRASGFRGPPRDGKRPKEVVEDVSGLRCLNVIVKSDVNGTLEAILNVLDSYADSAKVKLNLIGFDVGPVTQGDLDLAETFDAVVYCFNIDAVKSSLEAKGVRVKHFNVIYRLFEDLKAELELLAPDVETESVVGEAAIAQTFDIDDKKKVVTIGGGRCSEGLIDSRKLFKLVRESGEVVASAKKCKSLKHFKSDVVSIKKGAEFGFAFDDAEVKMAKGDKLVCYEIKMVKEKIDWDFGF